MADIFISYAREDRERAKEIADALTARGWSVWWDREMLVGKAFSEVIEREIATARCVIVLWSADSLKSRWVRNEAADGAAREVLVPVLIDDSRLPLEFSHLHTANLANWEPGTTTEDLEDLMSSVAALLAPGASASPRREIAAPPPRRSRNMTFIAIAAAAVILIGAFLLWVLQKPAPQVDTVPAGTTTAESPPVTDTIVTQTTPPPADTAPPPDPLPYGAMAVGALMEGERARCTAFLVSSEIALTSAACVKNLRSRLELKLGSTRKYPVTVQEENNGFALLKLGIAASSRTFPPIGSRTRAAHVGETATLLYHEDGKDLKTASCVVTKLLAAEMQYRCAVGRGASGGPLLGSDHVLLGFHNGSVRGSDRLLRTGVPASVFAGKIRRPGSLSVRPSG